MPENIGYQFNRLYPAPFETYRQVNTINQRNSIPPEIRWEGMECYVVTENQDYQLVGGVDNSNWVNAGETVSNPTTHFKGFFNATTLTPAISNLNGIEGDEYKVTNGGVNVDFGSGNILLETDDIIIFYQSEWRVKVRPGSGGTDAVVSVFGRLGAVVANSGDYAAFYKPIGYVPAWAEITGKPTFGTVATSNSYNDLDDLPTIFDSNAIHVDIDNEYSVAPNLSTNQNPNSGFLVEQYPTGKKGYLAFGNFRAHRLATSSGNIQIGNATAPTAGQVLTATSSSTAEWQTPSGGNNIDFLEYDKTNKTVWNNGNGAGSDNTSFGQENLISKTTGSQNSAFGNHSLPYSTTGSHNTAVGDDSGAFTSTGDNLTIVNSGLFLGDNSRSLANNSINEIVIGADSVGNGDNTATLGNDSTTDTYLKGIIHGDGSGLTNLPSGSSNPNIVAITTEAQLIDPANANKILDIQGNFSLTANRTLPNGAILKDGGGRINVNGYEVTFVNNSFDFPHNRIVMDFYKDTTYELFNYTAVGGETSLNIGALIDTKLNYILKVGGIIRLYGQGQSFTITQGATTTFNFYNTLSPLTAGTEVEVLYVSAFNGSRSRINNASTFMKGDINLRCFGLIGDGDVNTNTGTDNRNVLLEATKIANITGSNLYIKGAGNFMTSLIRYNEFQSEPHNWYITNGVKLYLDPNIKIGVLTVTGQTNNELLTLWNTEYSLVKGGELVGDLKTHVFQSQYDEGCHGIRLVGDSNTRYNTIDGVKLTDFVGDDTYSSFNPEFFHYNVITSATLTKGYTLDNAGLPVANPDYAYSQLLSLTNFHGVNPMVVGGSSFAGFMGLNNQTYYAYYYDASGNFLAKTGLLKLYQPVPVNSAYKQIRIVIHTPNDNYVDFDSKPGISIYAPARPTHTTVINCDLKYAFRNGISNLTQGSRILNSTISYIGRKHNGESGTLGLGIDLEDGYQNLQNVEIAYNTFVNNKTGNLTLIGSVDCSIHDNKFIYTDDPSFGSTNRVQIHQSTRTQFYNNLAQGTTITLGRQSEIFNSNLQDCIILFFENKESFRDNTNLLNVNLQQSTVDKFKQVSYIRNNVFKYTKLTNTPVFKNSLHWIMENNVFDFGEITVDREALGNNELQYIDNLSSTSFKQLSQQTQSEVSKGNFKNFVIKNLKPTPDKEWSDYFQWGVVDMDDFSISTSVNILAGGVKNATYKNGIIKGRLTIRLQHYPNTNTGLFSTLFFDKVKIEVPANNYLQYLVEASLLTSLVKDVNLDFKNSHFIMPDGSNDNKWFNLKHNGTTLFENCTFESLGTSSASLASSTAGVVKFLDCDFKNTTLVPRATDKVLYTKPNANCPAFADNATAVAALGVGWYYKDSADSNKFKITY